MRIEIKSRHQKWYLWATIATFLIYVPFAVWSFFEGEWFNLIWLLMPPFYLYIYVNYRKNMTGRFIQWDDEQIEYYMPYQKQKVILEWNEIENFEVKVLSIELTTRNGVKVISLNAVTYEFIQTLKKELPLQFQKIKSGTAA